MRSFSSAAAVIALRGPQFTGVGFFLLTLFYAVQIYADFTGGIDMTIGLSQALGIDLAENFIRPFFSKNIAEYWRRWHITLGEWMKSYIFYPISVSQPMLKLSKKARSSMGNFGKRLPVYVASIATWLVTGIWHGITPNFILWGMMNCFVIVVSEELNPLYEKFHNRFGWKEKKWYGAFEILRMFLLMNLIRIVDLFPNVADYFRRMGSLVTTFNFQILWDRLGLRHHLGRHCGDVLREPVSGEKGKHPGIFVEQTRASLHPCICAFGDCSAYGQLRHRV